MIFDVFFIMKKAYGYKKRSISMAEVSLSEAELAEIDELLDNLEMPVYGQKK